MWAGAFALLALAGFFMKISADFSRLLVRRLVRRRLRRCCSAVGWSCRSMIRRWARNGTMERRAVIVGGGKAAEALIRSLEQQPDNDIRICGIFDDRDDKRSPPIVAGYPKLGTIAELIEFARIARIDMLIVSLPLTAETRVLSLLKKLWVLPVDIRLSAHTNQLRSARAPIPTSAPCRCSTFSTSRSTTGIRSPSAPSTSSSACVGIVVFSPVMLATAIAIKLDSKGPVLFRQKRHGFNNEIIEVYKFRSMYTEHRRPDRQADGHQERPARHPRRPLHPQDLDRRTAAVLQRAARLAVAGRPAPACRRGAVAQPALQRSGRRLFRPPPGQARRHRLGADQWLARRDGHRREDPDAHRVRPLLHRELVAVVRSQDPAADAVPAAQHGKRVLSAIAASAAARRAVNAKLIALHLGRRRCALGVFLSGFVIDEPAPYELYMAGLIARVGAVRPAHLARRSRRCWSCSSPSTSAA